MMRLGAAMLAGVLFAAPAAAEMSVATFLAKATALEKRGMMAMFSSDVKPLMAEMKQVTTSYRSEHKAAKAAGRATHSCPPAKTKMGSDEFMNHLKAIPPAEAQRITVKTAFYGMMKKKFPCPA